MSAQGKANEPKIQNQIQSGLTL